MRYFDWINIGNHLIKIAHKYYDKDTYEIIRSFVALSFNFGMENMMDKEKSLTLDWDRKKKLMIKYDSINDWNNIVFSQIK